MGDAKNKMLRCDINGVGANTWHAACYAMCDVPGIRANAWHVIVGIRETK